MPEVTMIITGDGCGFVVEDDIDGNPRIYSIGNQNVNGSPVDLDPLCGTPIIKINGQVAPTAVCDGELISADIEFTGANQCGCTCEPTEYECDTAATVFLRAKPMSNGKIGFFIEKNSMLENFRKMKEKHLIRQKIKARQLRNLQNKLNKPDDQSTK